MAGYTANPIWLAIYALFVLTAAYHFGNGIFNFACKGVCHSRQPALRPWAWHAVAGLGLWLGFASLWGLTFSPWAR
jgi:succinate dehydrogenase hydrophobic anchor subunit